MAAWLGWARLHVGWGELFRRTGRQVWRDNCLGWAAQLAFYFFLSLFPALLFLVALASFFSAQELMDQILSTLAHFAPGDVLTVVRDQIQEIARGNNGGLLTLGILGTIWSTSSGMVAIIDTLNSAYHVQESRSWWRVRLTATALTIALSLFIVVSFGLVLAGPRVAEELARSIGLDAAFVLFWKIFQWPIVFLLVVSGIGLVYYFAPDVEQEWRWIMPGALAATAAWLLISLAFKWYAANLGAFNKTYGTIGGVIATLLWFYVSSMAILIGAEMNAVIEHASPDGKAPGRSRPSTERPRAQAAMPLHTKHTRTG